VRLKQTLYGEISESERINHPVRYKVEQLSADGYSQLTIAGIIAEGLIRPQHMPNGREGLVHRRKYLGIVYVCSGILRGHQAPCPSQAGARPISLSRRCPFLFLTDDRIVLYTAIVPFVRSHTKKAAGHLALDCSRNLSQVD